MKKRLLLMILQMSVIACFADEYKDPETNVIYTYDPRGNQAEVKAGKEVCDDTYGEVFIYYTPGSPGAQLKVIPSEINY